MNMLNTYCRLWKLLRASMDSFIDCLNHFIWSNAEVLHGQLHFNSKEKSNFSEFMNSAALLDMLILLEFMFKSLPRSIRCMPMYYCDLQATPTYMYLHERKWAIITLRGIFEIVYALNIISSPIIIQMIYLLFVHNQALYIYKMQFLLSKPVSTAFRCNWYASNLSRWRHIDKSNAIRFLLITCRGGFTEPEKCIWLLAHIILYSVKHLYTTWNF